MNFARFLRILFLQNTSGWLLLFYNNCWLYTLQLYIACSLEVVKKKKKKKTITKIHPYISRILQIQILFFIFFGKCLFCLPCQLPKACAVPWAAHRFVGSETPKHNDCDQFWKFQIHFKYFPRNTWFVTFDRVSNYLHLFKNHWQTFGWSEERPPTDLKATKMWFSRSIK